MKFVTIRTLILVFFQLISLCLIQTEAQLHNPFIKFREDPELPVFESDAKLLHCKYYSDTIKQEIGYAIYLPKSYFTYPDSLFPVLFYLHGYGSNYLPHGFSSVNYWDLGIEDTLLREMVIVYPNGVYDSFYTGKSEVTIIKELIPHILSAYRVSDSRECMTLSGFSAGGNGTMRFALLYPELFKYAIPMGGGRFIDMEMLIDQYLEDLTDTLTIWMGVGLEDGTLEGNRELHNMLLDAGIENTLNEFPGIEHSTFDSFADSLYRTTLFSWLDSQLQNSCKSVIRNSTIPQLIEEDLPYVDEYHPTSPVPFLPLGLAYQQLSDTAFQITWDENFYPVEFYTLEVFDHETRLYGLADTVAFDSRLYIANTTIECNTRYTYRIIAYNENGRSAAAIYNIITGACPNNSGEVNSLAEIIIYPQPSSGYLNIELNTEFPYQQSLVSIFSEKGEKVFENLINEKHSRFCIEQLRPGNYILMIKTSSEVLYSGTITVL